VIELGWVQPCKTIDIGCGLGNYSHYLVERGFEILAVDFSAEAIKAAQKLYQDRNLRFKVHSALDLSSLNEKFDFIFEVSLLHHIKPEERDMYVREIVAVANNGAKILVCCFSDEEKFFEGHKDFANPETNTVTYPLSKKEVEDLFSKYFNLERIQEVEFGKKSSRKRLLIQMQYN
jgi:cyclopropane fatty-acyl-phospholipid synthase-like methyltransferase